MALNSTDKFASYDMPDGSFPRGGVEPRPKIKGPNMAKAAKLVAKDFVNEAKFMQRKLT